MSTSAFLDKYFECVDSMPQDLQRYVTQLREIELEKRDLMQDVRRLRDELTAAVKAGSKKQMVIFRKLQESLLEVREMGNVKLSVSAEMLDTVEDYSQQLGLRAKELEANPRGEELLHPPRYSNSSLYLQFKGDSPLNNGLPEAKSSTKRTTSTSKRPRQPAAAVGEKPHKEDTPPFNNGGTVGKDGGGGGANRAKESASSAVVASGGGASTSNGKPLKKKVKTIKKSSKVTVTKEKETLPQAPPPAHVPMPDLTSQPLDPDEPTYCLCQQVSFGEMIGCDNDDCQIEWFHFQCVGLVTKPKGKWYCPNCTQERKAKANK